MIADALSIVSVIPTRHISAYVLKCISSAVTLAIALSVYYPQSIYLSINLSKAELIHTLKI